MKTKPFFYLTIISLLLASCSDVDVIVPDKGDVLEITNTGTVEIFTDNGEVGVILDVRPINYKGYTPRTATISFPAHSRFDAVLDINQDLNLTAFRILNDSLSQEEKQDFSDGVETRIEIKNGEAKLGIYEGNLNINSSNEIVIIDTDLEFIPGDVNIAPNTKHLIAFKTQWGTINTPSTGVLTRVTEIPEGMVGALQEDVSYEIMDYPLDRARQIFYFHHIEGNKYKIRLPAVCLDSNGNIVNCPDPPHTLIPLVAEGYIGVNRENSSFSCGQSIIKVNSLEDAAIFELVPKENGWMNMFLISENANNPRECGYWTDWSDSWWSSGQGALVFTNDNNLPIAEIRVISDDIDYEAIEVGNIYYQPIMGPTTLDFSFRSTIVNCSGSTIQESVGRVETKSRTTTVSTTESFQLFSSSEAELSTTLGFEVKSSAGGKILGVGAESEVSVNGSVTASYKYTQSSTTSTQNTMQEQFTDQIEVSRVRTATILPFSGVEIFDYIESNNNVVVPFVKKLRISGRNRSTYIRLSGIELISAVQGNLFGGLITKIDNYYIEVSLRGNTLVNSVFVAFSGANEIQDACAD